METKITSPAPVVITYRKVFRRPKFNVESKFVGFRKAVHNAWVKLLALVDDVAFETKQDLIDPGESKAVHWALHIERPWESGSRAGVVAIQIPGDVPHSGLHCEVISIVEEGEEDKSIPARKNSNGTSAHDSDVARSRIREALGSGPYAAPVYDKTPATVVTPVDPEVDEDDIEEDNE